MADYTVPSNLQGYWTLADVGVPGGIEQYRPGGGSARPTYNDLDLDGYTDDFLAIDKTGATNVQTAIQAAINACPSGYAVVIPPGTYRIDGELQFLAAKSGRTLRGAGVDSTILDCRAIGGRGVRVGQSEEFDYPASGTVVTSTRTRGTTTVTIGSSTGFSGKQYMRVICQNKFDAATVASGEEFWMNTSGDEYQRKALYLITGVSGNDVSFWPPLPFDATGLTMRLNYAQGPTTGVGIEDLTITGENISPSGNGLQSGIQFVNSRGCWMYNVKSIEPRNYCGSLAYAIQCTIQHCIFQGRLGSGTSGGAFLFDIGNTLNLFWDNILLDNSPLIEIKAGAIDNVIAYNLFEEYINNAVLYHSCAVSHNLWEGNVLKSMHVDGYFGSSSRDTWCRNYLSGIDQNGDPQGHQIILRRFARDFAFVGNILGTDGIQSFLATYGDANFGGAANDGTTAQPSLGDFWKDFGLTGTLTTRTSDTAGVMTFNQTPNSMATGAAKQRIIFSTGEQAEVNVTAVSATTFTFTGFTAILPLVGTAAEIWTGLSGWQEVDLDVEPSTILVHNYEADASGTGEITNALGGGTTLGDSLFLDEAPEWFDTAWPPFDPASPPSDANYITAMRAIPAGARYFDSIPLAAPEVALGVSIIGTPTVGYTLTIAGGTFTGNPSPTITYAWYRDAVLIGGETGSSYDVAEGDQGTIITGRKTATNSEGSDYSEASAAEITPFMGDVLTLIQTANTDPVTELIRRAVVTAGVAGTFADEIIQHSGPYPSQPENGYAYAKHGTTEKHCFVFEGTLDLAAAQAARP